MSKDEATRLADALEGYPSEHLLPETREAAALLRRWPDGEPFCYLRQTSSERNPPHGWAVYVSGRPEDVPVYIAPPDQARRIAALEGEAPALPKADVSVPFYKATVTLAQGDYYRADKVLPLLKNWAVLYAAAKAGHEQAFAQSQEKSERIAALDKQLQRYIGASARYQIEIGIIEDIFKGEDDFTPSDMEYWGPLHDKAREQVRRIAALEAQVADLQAANKRAVSAMGGMEAALEQSRLALRDARASLDGRGHNAGLIAHVDAALRAIGEVSR